MIRLGKMTDYGIVLLSYFADSPQDTVFNARELAQESRLPVPTVSKILKTLSRGGLLSSQRGVSGGYRLARSPRDISIAQVITMLEGPIAMTECSSRSPSPCEIEPSCPIRGNWRKINDAVHQALDELTLSDMNRPLPLKLTQALVTERQLGTN